MAAFRGGAEVHMYQVYGEPILIEPERFVDSIASPIKAMSTKVSNEEAHASF